MTYLLIEKGNFKGKNRMLTSFLTDYVLLCSNMPYRTAAESCPGTWEPIIPTMNIGAFCLSDVNISFGKNYKVVERLEKRQHVGKNKMLKKAIGTGKRSD